MQVIFLFGVFSILPEYSACLSPENSCNSFSLLYVLCMFIVLPRIAVQINLCIHFYQNILSALSSGLLTGCKP